MNDNAPINSLEWWEHYFAQEWEAHSGPAQTRHFMQQLLRALPAIDRALLTELKPTIADWGCAFGDGTNELAQNFAGAQVVGIDSAATALRQARERYPALSFEHADTAQAPGTLPRPFDVVVASNCLEHFDAPLQVLQAGLASTRLLHLTLVPYREAPLSVHHRVSLDESSFPEAMAGFKRLWQQVVDVDTTYWPGGKQLLVAYASPAYCARRDAFEPTFRERAKWEAYYTTLPLLEIDASTKVFNDEFTQIVGELLPPGSAVLEAGCGGGNQSLALAQAGFDASLLDFSPAALDYARRLFQHHGATARFVEDDAFAARSPAYDLVFNAGVLEHYTLDEQARFLRGMASRSRAYVLVLIPNRACYWYWVWRTGKTAAADWPFGKEVPQTSLADAFAAAGLEHLGECYLGAAWSEYFITSQAGLDTQLKQQLLELHRSPVIPGYAKGYLTAALGRVKSAGAGDVPLRWRNSTAPAEGSRREENWIAMLADALAGKIAAEQRAGTLPQLKAELAGAHAEVGKLSSERDALTSERARLTAERDQLAAERERLASERDQLISARDALATDRDRLAAERDHLTAERDHLTADRDRLAAERTALSADRERLMAERDVTIGSLEAARNDAAAAQALANQLRSDLHRVQGDLQTIYRSRGFRLLQAARRVRLKLVPRGSHREQAARFAWATARKIRNRLRGTAIAAPLPAAPAAPAAAKLASPVNSAGSQTNVFDLDGYTPRCARYAVVVLPIIAWGFRFQRPQQIARQFAQAGHSVLFASHDFRNSVKTRDIEPNVTEIDLPGRAGTSPYREQLDEHSARAMAEAIVQWLRARRLESSACIVQLPFWAPVAAELRRQLGCPIVYDCMDDHAGFTNNTATMLDAEERLLADADLTVVSSDVLMRKIESRARKAILIRNACDYPHFAAVRRAPRRADRPLVIGYYGAIADWFDSQLVAEIARLRPDWQFVLIGNTWSANLSPLEACPNIKLPGEAPYATLPAAMQAWDCCIIPFQRLPLTEATNPVKVYEMLAAGMPVVAVDLPELRPLFASNLIRRADRAQNFVATIEASVAEDSEALVQHRREFARANTWTDRFSAFDTGIRALYPLVSIAVVTFNNLVLNRLCLASLLENTDYPNFEVIVVDNGSTDGTPEFLEQVQDPRVRVLLNADNRGFAAANNQAVELARGDYICLLNNDTVVTGAWLSTLVGHLRANPGVGLIGPVTNAIGNEARIDVGYSRLADMPRWADGWCREHRGQLGDIPMLAFFCVVMSRRVWAEVGTLDVQFGKGMFEDDDYCRRARAAGYSIKVAFDSFIHHWQRASFGQMGDAEYLRVFYDNQRHYQRKWKDGSATSSAAAATSGIAASARRWIGRLLGQTQPLRTVAAADKPAVQAAAAPRPDQYTPYGGIRLLKEIAVEVIDTDFDATHLNVPFSLVTTIKNEAAGILEFLSSIEGQTVRPAEVIIVDGGSTDGTLDLLKDFQQRSQLQIQVIEAPGANIAAGRNRGIAVARNELLVLTDAGSRLEADFCKNLIGCHQLRPDVDLASGICVPLRGPDAFFVPEWDKLDWSVALPSARTLAIRKSLALQIGGFPEHLTLTGEDTLFDVNYRRVSRRWVFNRKSVIHWDAPVTEAAAQRLAFSYGKGDGESGIGDYLHAAAVTELARQYPYVDAPTDNPVWREFYCGYLEGRQRRAQIEFERRGIPSVVLVLSVNHLASPGNNTAEAALQMLARGFKVVFVTVQPYDGPARWFDVDFTRLELYAADKFNWEECLGRYAAYSDRVYALYPEYHPALGALVERLKAKTGNRLKFRASVDEIERDLAAPGPIDSSADTSRPPKTGPAPSLARPVGVGAGSGQSVAPAGAASNSGALGVAGKFWSIARDEGVTEAVRRGYAKLAQSVARPAASPPSAAADALQVSPFGSGQSYDVVSFPIMPWSSRFQRSQQLLTRFAAHGTRIFRVDRGFLVDDPHDYTHQVVHENILQVTLGASRNLSIYTDSIDPASLELMLRSFEAMRAEWQIGNALCVVELPFWYPLAKELGKRYGWEVVYDCMDEHEDFATNEGQMVSKEAELAREAALVVVTSQYLERKMAPLNPRRALIRNATDFNHFARRPEEDLCSGITHPIIGYYGAISEWFDQELVAHAARKLNYCSFVLIGGNDAGGSLATLEQCPNVRLLGEQPYAQLPKYLHSFDVCIIPFQLRKLMEATNPVKFYEYISAGKPVVSVMLPELFPYRDHLYLADGKDDFVAKIEQALNERDDSIRQGRIALARDNTWEKRYQAFRDAVDALFPRVSIIVITFGNLDLTRRCIDSIFAKSQYPNFEVIIVDNASTDGTPEYLRDLAARNASVKIILNQDNKGFAAANNQGLAIAGGDIIVLLNNDTVVTPGWLSKLTRYLRDESIGMVGPATNMCGNESIIHVPYNVDTLDDLDAFAQRYHQLHPLPEAFDIDMLAMFCVAFRRKTFERIGPLDERFGLGMFEDTDYAERLKRAGYRIASARDVFVHHNCKASFGKLPNADYTRIYEENRRKFEEKWQRQSQY